MAKKSERSYQWLKNYFSEHFPMVSKVQVVGLEEGPDFFEAGLKVKAGRHWFFVRKRGEHYGQAMKKARNSMAEKLRRSWEKIKARPNKKSLKEELYNF